MKPLSFEAVVPYQSCYKIEYSFFSDGLRIGQIDGGLVARDQPLVAVGRGAGESQEGRSVLEQPADRVQGHLAQPGVAAAGK